MNDHNDFIVRSIKNRVLTLTLNRPEAKNSIVAEMTVQLHQLLSEAAIDDNVGAIVITGTGNTFCAGGDVKRMSSTAEAKPAYSTEELLYLGAQSSMLLHQMPKPTIAMIRGAAAGGGLSLAMGCDFRFSDDSAKLTFAYTNIALSGDFAGAYLIQHWIGASKARSFCLLCPLVDAQESLDLGLITEVLPKTELEDHVYNLAGKLANGPTGALGRIKQNLNNANDLLHNEYINIEAENFLVCRASNEHKEALTAFMEKRAPKFHR